MQHGLALSLTRPLPETVINSMVIDGRTSTTLPVQHPPVLPLTRMPQSMTQHPHILSHEGVWRHDVILLLLHSPQPLHNLQFLHSRKGTLDECHLSAAASTPMPTCLHADLNAMVTPNLCCFSSCCLPAALDMYVGHLPLAVTLMLWPRQWRTA